MTRAHIWQRLEQQFQQQCTRERLPHALLFVGATVELRKAFIERCMAYIKTSEMRKIEIIPEQAGGTIKVDQIRDLQHQVYSVFAGTRVFVVIDPVNKLNRAAMNALLKILEEPPEPVTFFLSADHLATVIPTIRSRCCHYYLPTENNTLEINNAFLSDWCDVLQQRKSASSVAQAWSKDQVLLSVLEKMYYLIAMALRGEVSTEMKLFCALTTPQELWNRFDHLHILLQKIHENMAINAVLAIESLLIPNKELL